MNKLSLKMCLGLGRLSFLGLIISLTHFEVMGFHKNIVVSLRREENLKA